jgi:transcriptional regulator
MYVPNVFALNDAEAIAEAMRRYDFALLVTAAGGAPQASHLPVLHDPARGDKGTLLAHMARANPQWKDFAKLADGGGEALVVFQGPHAYVSPNWYGPGAAVPTWNYISIHAYGPPQIIDDPARVRALLDRLVRVQERGSQTPWSMESQDDDYLERMMRGIVAFEIPVRRLEAKAKLSQNKELEDRRAVVAALSGRGDPLAAEVAEAMRALVLDD